MRGTLTLKVPPRPSGKPSFPRMTITAGTLRHYRLIQKAWGDLRVKLDGELLQRHKDVLGGWSHEGKSQWDTVNPGFVIGKLLDEVEALHSLLEDALAQAERKQP